MFDDKFFEQAEGAAISSPLSPVVANLYMEAFEERGLEFAVSQPRLWLWYVDDTFVLWPYGVNELDTFLNHLNSQHPTIQFMMEKENISFLDALVKGGNYPLESIGRTSTQIIISTSSHIITHT